MEIQCENGAGAVMRLIGFMRCMRRRVRGVATHSDHYVYTQHEHSICISLYVASLWSLHYALHSGYISVYPMSVTELGMKSYSKSKIRDAPDPAGYPVM